MVAGVEAVGAAPDLEIVVAGGCCCRRFGDARRRGEHGRGGGIGQAVGGVDAVVQGRRGKGGLLLRLLRLEN